MEHGQAEGVVDLRPCEPFCVLSGHQHRLRLRRYHPLKAPWLAFLSREMIGNLSLLQDEP